ncbi:unnamed protein product, partial [Adineta ricciae]
MFVLKIFFYIVHLILLTNLIQSQIICLDNDIITCKCDNEKSLVTCIEHQASETTFIDWSTFSSVQNIYSTFNFINFTRLTSDTFTSFSSRFSSLYEIKFTFVNGIGQIEANTFQFLNSFSTIPIYIKFSSPKNFQLANYAFTPIKCKEITIENIQYDDIHNSAYQFNLKAFINTTITDMSIRNFQKIQFI